MLTLPISWQREDINEDLLQHIALFYTANVYTQTTDLLLFSDVVITHKNV